MSVRGRIYAPAVAEVDMNFRENGDRVTDINVLRFVSCKGPY